MEVVGGLAVDTALILALLVLVELLEAILGIGIIFDVVALVLLNVTLVLEGECTPRSPARASRRGWLAVMAELLSPASLQDKNWGCNETTAPAAEELRSCLWVDLGHPGQQICCHVGKLGSSLHSVELPQEHGNTGTLH